MNRNSRRNHPSLLRGNYPTILCVLFKSEKSWYHAVTGANIPDATIPQHNSNIADGVSGLTDALAALAQQNIQMIYTTTHQVLAEGNYVLAVSEGTYGGVPTAYYDLWRVENGKIAEHWDVMESIADPSTWANANGKF